MRSALLALGLALAVPAAGLAAGETPGLAVGSDALAFEGPWITSNGRAPALDGKAYLVMFWYER
jgi:hypothetical protein